MVGNNETVRPESLPAEILESGAALVRLENTTQMQMAIQRPRDEAKILTDALNELDLYPSMAAEAIYRKPVGKDEGEDKFAEGLSIRAAESLANRWDNSAHGVSQAIDPENGDVLLTATFLDYEKNIRHQKTRRVSQWYRSREGKLIQYSPDRFSNVVVPARESIILREVILRSMPPGLRKEYEKKARDVIAGGGNIADRLTKMVRSFDMIGVSAENIEATAGKKIAEFTGDDLADMIGLYNAIRDKQTTIYEAFGIGETNGKPEEPNLKPKDGYDEAFGENGGQGDLLTKK